ncbi:MAG: hypothetical protein M3T55_00600 [Pseudomonadota bacterium]|nr:hypothetical protein [Pseudomonadota bacterium]
MSPERFEALAGAFGGDLERWPRSERQGAYHLAAAHPALTDRVLDDARRLDGALGAAPSISPSHQLREWIVQAAPGPQASRAAWRWAARFGLTAGLAGAAAAGVAVAIAVAPTTLARPHAGSVSDPVEEAALLLREPSDLGEV